MWTTIDEEKFEEYINEHPELEENKESYKLFIKNNKIVLPYLFHKNFPSKLLKIIGKNIPPEKVNFTFNLNEFPLRNDQINIYNKIMPDYYKTKSVRGVIKARPGAGKAQPITAKLLTPTGWTTMGEIKVGDKLIGSTGTPINVTGVFPQGIKPVYKITFYDNDAATECCEDHLWTVKNRNNSKKYQTVDLKTILDNFKSKKKKDWFIPVAKPIEFECQELEKPPFIVGQEIGECINQNIYKEIPKKYLFNTIETRLDLLCGIISAINYTNKYSIGFILKNKKFAEDLQFIIRSLGGITYIEKVVNLNINEIDDIYSLYYLISNDNLKKRTKKYKIYNKLRFLKPCREIKTIEFTGYKECQCIKVDSEDSLYITDDFILTHNTAITICLASKLGFKSLFLSDNSKLMEQWKSEIIKFTNLKEKDIGVIKQNSFDTDKPISVGSVQTLLSRFKNDPVKLFKKIEEAKYGLVSFDEVHKSAASEKYSKISSIFRVPNIIGLSATPYKTGWQDILMKNCIGEILYDSKDYDLKPLINFIFYESGLNKYKFVLNKITDYAGRKAFYNKNIIKSEKYFDLIIKYTKKSLNENHRIIIVCWTTEQITQISERLTKEGIENRRFYGKEREFEKTDKVLVATYAYAGHGFNYKELSCVLLACPLSGKVSLIQTIGRILRESDGKEAPIVYDLVDLTFPTLFLPDLKQKKKILENEFSCEFNEIQEYTGN